MDIRQKLDEKIKNLPENPGVYVMYDKDGHVLYVGKARCLKTGLNNIFISQQTRQKKSV